MKKNILLLIISFLIILPFPSTSIALGEKRINKMLSSMPRITHFNKDKAKKIKSKLIYKRLDMYLLSSEELKIAVKKRHPAKKNIYMPGEFIVRLKGKGRIYPRVKPSKVIDPITLSVMNNLKKRSKEILYIEPNYIVQVNSTDPIFGDQWALHNTGQSGGTVDADIDAPKAWAISEGSEEVVIAVIDTGIDLNHEDLSANLWVNNGEIPGNGIDDDDNGYVDDVHGYTTAFGYNGPPMDVLGHGTHVAGTIASEKDNNLGGAGTCPNCKVMAIKAFGDDGKGYTSNIISGLLYGRYNGAKVFNMSFGGIIYKQSLYEVIQDGYNYYGIFHVASAGNRNSDKKVYPAAYDNVLAVASTDDDDIKAGHSSYGEWVDISAPGKIILSSFPPGTDITNSCGDSTHGDPDDGYGNCNGTSMASPHAAAVGGLLYSHIPGISPDDSKMLIKVNADNIYDIPGNTQYDGLLGTGRLNAMNTLKQISDLRVTRFKINIVSPDKLNLPITIKNFGPGKAKLSTFGISINGKVKMFGGTPALNPGEEYSKTQAFPLDHKPNDKLTLKADFNNAVKEYRENNNSKSRIIPHPDLKVSDFLVKGDLKLKKLIVSFTIKNKGASKTPASAYAIKRNGSNINTGAIPSLSPQSSKNFGLILDLPFTNNDIFLLMADSNETITESNENNNSMETTITPIELPLSNTEIKK
ncbi:MAG: S8 family serine peptidase [Deltaproteobacteria bacterium]|nr:S8 family serine peptidase [Deltaproteobacteria bacterium]